jgi:uncharacterized RDD family membrane protein YckC
MEPLLEQDDRIRNVATPEAIALPMRLADGGQRVMAVFIDVGIVLSVILVSNAFCEHLFDLSGRWSSFVTLGVLVSFFMRTTYFILLEGWWRGQTIGKRFLGIRVVDRSGGTLTMAAIVARNAMREIELFLPLSLYFIVFDGAFRPHETKGATAAILGLVWSFTMVMLPLFNADRCRAGDFVAGTWVIEVPKAVLLPDLVESELRIKETRFTFSDQQLDLYGKHELRLLGDLLRGDVPATEELLDDVATRIRRKIRWRGDASGSRAFLQAFYAAQRAHLEKRMIMGEARETKRE